MLNYQYIICPAFPFSSEIWFFWKSVLKWNDQQYYLCSTSPEFHLPPPSPSITVSPSLWRIVCPAFLEQGCLRHSRTGTAPQQSLLKVEILPNLWQLRCLWQSCQAMMHIIPPNTSGAIHKGRHLNFVIWTPLLWVPNSFLWSEIGYPPPSPSSDVIYVCPQMFLSYDLVEPDRCVS